MHHWRVLLDLDGTTAQNAGRALAARQFGLDLSQNTDPRRTLPELLSWTEAEFWAWWHANQEEIYRLAVPIAGAREVVRALKADGAFIAVVTARRSDARDVTVRWLARYAVPYDHIVMEADDKAAVGLELGLTVGFEDDPAHALALAALMPVLLLDGHKNTGQEIAHPRIHRMSTWDEALPLLQRLGERSA